MKPEIVAKHASIASTARVGNDVRIVADTVTIGAGAIIGDSVKIEGREILIEDGAQIRNGVTVRAEAFTLGYRSRIEESCKLMALDGSAKEIRFGDNCLFGAFNSGLVPMLLVGDYVKIHNHTLISGFNSCFIGHNSWIGQNCVLNSNDVLFIGNNVGVGTYTSIWTHAFFGEILEGSTVFNVAPTIIEDDVWIVGAYNVVSPGLTIGKRSMVLTSSVVSGDVLPEHTVGGVPARDMTDRLPPVRRVSLDEKMKMMRGFVQEFVDTVYAGRHTRIPGGYRVAPDNGVPCHILVQDEFDDREFDCTNPTLLYLRTDNSVQDYDHLTVFDLTTKQYIKRRTDPEIQIIGFMNSFRARFVPRRNPRIGVMPVVRQ
jgi:acetyltransferase-like isoleucine patch superfamily enzyme